MTKTNEYKCKHCGYIFNEEVSTKDIAIAEEFNQKSLYTVWICPKCGKDNGTEIKITD